MGVRTCGYTHMCVHGPQVSTEGTVHTELIEESGESRYKIIDIIGKGVMVTQLAVMCMILGTILAPHLSLTPHPSLTGKKDGIGVENLRGSGMIAGETSQAYEEVFTISLVGMATHPSPAVHCDLPPHPSSLPPSSPPSLLSLPPSLPPSLPSSLPPSLPPPLPPPLPGDL